MKRTLLAIGLLLSAGLAHAGGVVNRTGASTECPNKGAEKAPAADEATDTVSTATRPAKSTRGTSSGGGGTSSTKLVSPRWHSLLPGMFR